MQGEISYNIEQASNFVPSLTDFGFSEDLPKDSRSGFEFSGGEDQGLKRVREYISEALSTYKQTRNGLMGRNYSSKLSPWLACGAVSPRLVYHEVRDYEKKHL